MESRSLRPGPVRPVEPARDPNGPNDPVDAIDRVQPADGPRTESPARPPVALADQTLADLHVRYRRRLEAVAFRLLHDQDEAEDVVQRVFEALPRIDFRGQASLWTYLYRAAVNGALTVLRKRRRREVAETELRVRAAFGDPIGPEEGPDPEARVLEGEILSAVASALLHVKPQHRRALVLRIVWGLTNTEIAEREGVPLPTVGTWLRRGREELRARLGPLLRDLDLGEDAT